MAVRPDDDAGLTAEPASEGIPVSESPWGLVVRSGGARIAVLGVSLVLGLVITRWTITHYGQDTYAQYGLLVGIAALLPFADLGIGAAVMNTVGESPDPDTDDEVRGVLLTSLRALVASAIVIAAIAVFLTALGLWPAVFGAGLDEANGNLAAGLCVLIFALTLPLGAGQRILSGLGKNHFVVALSGLQSPIVLLGLLVMAGGGAWLGAFIPVLSYLALMLIAFVAMVLAARLVGGTLIPAIRDIPRLRSKRGGKASHMAVPMLIMTIALPISLQSDRIVLSHVSTEESLATYNMAAQLFTPLRAVISASGLALWAHFARARTAQADASPFPMSGAFGGVAAILCLIIAILSPIIVQVASAGQIELDGVTIVSFSALTIGLALTYPIGMYLSDAPGLRLQAVATVVVLPVNLGLSIVLAERLGTPGPVIASVLTTTILLGVQGASAWRRIRSPRSVSDAPMAGPAIDR